MEQILQGQLCINHEKLLFVPVTVLGFALTCSGLSVTPALLHSCITPKFLTLFVGNSLGEEL